MDNTLFYKLPKDILIELLHKVYGNLDGFPMEDIFRLEKICKERLEQDRIEKETIVYRKYKIDDNLVMYYTNHDIILEDSRIDIPKNRLTMKSVFEIKVHSNSHSYRFSFDRNVNGKIEFFMPFQFKTLEDLTPHIIRQLKSYNQNIVDECLKIINLILDTRDYLITNELNKYI